MPGAPAPAARPFFTPGALALAGIALLGWAFGLARLLAGLGAVTHLSDDVPWGLWIAVDVACYVTLAAGGFTAAALVEILGRDRHRALLRPALLSAWLGYIFVGLGLLFDLGRPWNLWRPAVHWQGNSVLFEVALCVMAYLVVLSVEVSPTLLEGLISRAEARGRHAGRLGRLLGPARGLRRAVRLALPAFVVAGVVLSCMHQSSLGALMLIAPSKLSPLWWTPALPLLFLLSAVMVGLPMVLLATVLAARALGRKAPWETLGALGRLMPWPLALYGLVRLGDLALRRESLWPIARPLDALALGLELLLGVLAPLAVLLGPARRRSPRWLLTASLLVVSGVVLNRIDVFLVGFHPPQAHSAYFPSLGEFALTAGLLATYLLVFRLLVRAFPVLTGGDGGDCPEPTALAPRRRWLARGLAAAFLIGFAAFYALVHEAAERGAPYPELEIAHRAQAWPKTPGEPQPSRPLAYRRLILLDNPVLNERADDFEPARFAHRAHDVSTRGDCAPCHHRHARQEGDRRGVELADLHRELEVERGGACATCHGDLADHPPQACSRCHGRPLEPDDPQRPGLKAALHRQCMGCHARQRGGLAPLDCRGCHRPHVPDHRALLPPQEDGTPADRCATCHPAEEREARASLHGQRVAGIGCLDCHLEGGPPAEARIGRPDRASCGACHLPRGGDELSGRAPDVHVARHGFCCQDCHRTRGHRIPGGERSAEGRVTCQGCHGSSPHALLAPPGDQLDPHARQMACAACHQPPAGVGSDARTDLSARLFLGRAHEVQPLERALGCQACHPAP